MSDRPWMPLNVEDYLSDTLHLSAAEHGAYLLLIMRYWKDGGLPADERLIQRYSRLTEEQWAESRDVLAAFFGDGWTHHRIDAELEKAAGIIEKRRAAANAKHVKASRDADALQVQSTSSDMRVPPVTKNISSSSLRSDEGAREPKRPVRLAEDWSLPSDWRSDAVAVGLPPDRIDLEAAKIRDWSRSASKGARSDWRAAWRNWCRRAADELPQARGSPQQPRPPSMADIARAFGERANGRQDIEDRGGTGTVVPRLSAVGSR